MCEIMNIYILAAVNQYDVKYVINVHSIDKNNLLKAGCCMGMLDWRYGLP